MGIDLPAAAIAWVDLSPIGPFVDAAALNGYEANFRAFAALAQPTVKSSLTTPPGSPADGDCYLVAVGGGAAWAGWDNRIVRYRAAGAVWESFIPKEGWSAYNQATDVELRFGGTTWAAKPPSAHAASHQGGSDTLAGQSIPGLLTTDSPAWVAVSAGVGKIANWAYNAGYPWFGLPAFNAATMAASAGFAASATGSIHLVAATGQGVNGWAGGVQKFQIDSTGVSIVSGSLQIAGVLAISGARAFDGTGLKLSGISATALAKFDATGNLIPAVGTESVKFSYAEIKAANATLKISCDPTTGQAAIQFGKGSTGTDYRIIQLWQESTDSLDFRSYHTDGGYLYTRLQIPRLSSLPVSINNGLDVFSGGLKVGGTEVISTTRAFAGISFTKTGGTAIQGLMADGGVSSPVRVLASIAAVYTNVLSASDTLIFACPSAVLFSSTSKGQIRIKIRGGGSTSIAMTWKIKIDGVTFFAKVYTPSSGTTDFNLEFTLYPDNTLVNIWGDIWSGAVRTVITSDSYAGAYTGARALSIYAIAASSSIALVNVTATVELLDA